MRKGSSVWGIQMLRWNHHRHPILFIHLLCTSREPRIHFLYQALENYVGENIVIILKSNGRAHALQAKDTVERS